MKSGKFLVDSDYEQVAQAEVDENSITCNKEYLRGIAEESSTKQTRQRKWKFFDFRLLAVMIPWVLVIIFVLLFFVEYLHNTLNNQMFVQSLYSPAQDVLRYEAKVFKSGLENNVDQKYYGEPSPEVDAAWEALYSFGPIKLDRWEAARLPNRTLPIADEPGKYIALIDVFHQLHCLDAIRKALRPDYYGVLDWTEFGLPHIGHCVDSIRESIMCMSDISVNVWQWDLIHNLSHSLGNSLHTCRNFDAIRSWAYDRRLIQDFDKHAFAGDDPLAGAFNLETNSFNLASPFSPLQ